VSLLFIVPLLHLVAAPYTKVEESFNLQATHDILVYGIPLPFVGGTSNGTHDAIERLSAYDHVTFPGAVPRTFTGAALLAALSKPIIAVAGFQHAQLVVRAVLGTANAACLLVFWRALRLAAGVGAARWWAAMIVTQFHIVYYLTRTLPNMYAFGLSKFPFCLS
jgi:alpha-1,6-mannosyltransferase